MLENKGVKYGIRFVLVLILIVLCALNTIVIASAANSTISIGSASTDSGTTITLPITISNTTNVTGVYFELKYDQSIATIKSITANNTIQNSSVNSNINNITGNASVALTNTDSITTTSPTPIIDVTFDVVGTTGNTTLYLQNVEFSDDNFTITSPEIVNDGKIQIDDTCSSCVYVNWNATISATNQLEPVSVGMHTNASDGFDESDVFADIPVQGKVTLTIDSLYAKSIKKSLLSGNNISWNISMGVPAGQTTSLDWNLYPDPSIALHIYNGTNEITSATIFSEGNHNFLVVAEILENINFNLHLNPGWNMVSLPLTPSNSSVEAIFGEISTLNIRPVVSWQSPLFITAENIEPKKGYWVFAPLNMDIVIIGTPMADTALSLSAGWNMIGTVGLNKLDLTKVPNQVSQRPPVIWQSPLFVLSNELESGKAAWLFVTQNTEVVI